MDHPGATTNWVMASGSLDHRIVDGTGLHLYDSGSRTPPASYDYSFWAAGTYSVVDSGTGSTMTLKVPTLVTPRSGSISTTFTITWASEGPGSHQVFDVQIRRPGSTQWTDWKTGYLQTGASFTPDSGTGIYSFRSRLRNTQTGAATGYSAAVSIKVS